MAWNYKLTKKQIEALKFLEENGGEVNQELADKKIHWRTQDSLYLKLLTDNIATGRGLKMKLNKRGHDALNAL